MVVLWEYRMFFCGQKNGTVWHQFRYIYRQMRCAEVMVYILPSLWMCVCGGQRLMCVFLIILFLVVWGRAYGWIWSTLIEVANQQALWIPPFPPPQCWDDRCSLLLVDCCFFSVGSMGSNLDLHACTPGTLPTEPSLLQPTLKIGSVLISEVEMKLYIEVEMKSQFERG